MNRIQKIALLMVICLGTGILACAIAFAVFYPKYGLEKAVALSSACFGIAGIAGLGPIIFGKDKGKVTEDERDRTIKQRAALCGFCASYVFICLACLIPIYVMGPQALMQVSWLGTILTGAATASFFVWGCAILVQYAGWTWKK